MAGHNSVTDNDVRGSQLVPLDSTRADEASYHHLLIFELDTDAKDEHAYNGPDREDYEPECALARGRPHGSARQTEEEADEAYVKSQIGVVPLGVPLLAGPGAISTVIIYALKESWLGRVVLIAEIWLVAAMVWLALSLGDWLTDRLGKTGINIATRIMGLLLAAIAVGFLTQGLKVLLPGLA